MAHVSMSFTKEDRIDETITYFPSKLSILNLPLLTTRPKALLRGNCSAKGNVKANLGKMATGSVGPLTGNVLSVQKKPEQPLLVAYGRHLHTMDPDLCEQW
jgi:hypothetical protein